MLNSSLSFYLYNHTHLILHTYFIITYMILLFPPIISSDALLENPNLIKKNMYFTFTAKKNIFQSKNQNRVKDNSFDRNLNQIKKHTISLNN